MYIYEKKILPTIYMRAAAASGAVPTTREKISSFSSGDTKFNTRVPIYIYYIYT